jgi:Ca2+-binding EF-hand superfamily protein
VPQDLLGRRPVLSKKEEMQQAISCLSQKEKDLAKQYFSFVDVDNSGWLDKRELKVLLLPLPSTPTLFCFA